MLMESTDQKLTATVQALRDENAQLTKLVAQARHAFVGEVAAKAADQARRGAAAQVAEELARLRLAVESGKRAIATDSPVASALRSVAAQASLAFCAGVAFSWIVGHLSRALGS